MAARWRVGCEFQTATGVDAYCCVECSRCYRGRLSVHDVWRRWGKENRVLTICLCQLDSFQTLFYVGPCDDHFRAADGLGARDDGGEVTWVLLLAVIAATEDWIGEIDTYLVCIVSWRVCLITGNAYVYVSWFVDCCRSDVCGYGDRRSHCEGAEGRRAAEYRENEF